MGPRPKDPVETRLWLTLFALLTLLGVVGAFIVLLGD